METHEETREVRLRRAAQRQGLTLQKSRTRDPLAISYGLFCIADAENRAVAGADLMGYSMSLDEVEVYLADAQDFDVYFSNPLGEYRFGAETPFLEWMDSYWFGRSWSSGWLLTERSDCPRDYFILRDRTELACAVREARAILDEWAAEDREEGAA